MEFTLKNNFVLMRKRQKIINKQREFQYNYFVDKRPLVRTTLGCHVLGAASPHPDPADLETMLDGASRRFCRKPPTSDPQWMSEFKSYVNRWLHEHMTPLAYDTDTSFYTWIENTPYPRWRKDQLIRTYEYSVGFITPDNIYDARGVINRYCKVNSFMKDEVYPTYKAARGINSRTDEFKVRVGPIFKLIEKELFALPYFIKHTPVDERAQEIKDNLYQEASNIIGTDYTSFESLFTLEFMEACEFQLYDYMTQYIDDQDWYEIVRQTLGGFNYCSFRDKFTMKVRATRMSGEMCTSLGNSFANLMAMKFMAHKKKMKSLKGRVEGDDGIFTFYGPVPTTEDFAKLGLIIKIDKYDKLTEGSFCGIITDEDEMINVTNPIESLLEFGWTTQEYARSGAKKKMELLRAKSLSLAYQYPGCPILNSLAQYGLRMSKDFHYNYKYMNEYERTMFLKLHEKYKNNIPNKVPGHKTRLLVEKTFGLTIEDQIAIEQFLDNKTDLSPFDCPAILSNCPVDALDYYDKYVFVFDDVSNLECPIVDGYSLEKIPSIFDCYERCYEKEKIKGASVGSEKTKTRKTWRPIERSSDGAT